MQNNNTAAENQKYPSIILRSLRQMIGIKNQMNVFGVI